jgi:hypothetical protein
MTSYIFTTTEPTEVTERGEKDSLTGLLINFNVKILKEGIRRLKI